MNSKNAFAYILGSVSFLPVFIASWIIGCKYSMIIGLLTMAIFQMMWLKAMGLLTDDLDKENKELKSEIKRLKELR